MNHIFSKLKTYLLMGFCISIGLSACKDDHGDLGVNIHPDNERLLVYQDSLRPLKTYSVQTSQKIKPTSGDALLGHIIDPLIGDYKSSFIANARPKVLSISLGDSIAIDSMYTYVKYDTVYGNYGMEHSLSIYEMYRDSNLTVKNLYGEPDDISSIASYYDPSLLLGQTTYIPEIRTHDSIVGLSPIKIDLLQTEAGKDLANRMLYSDTALYNYLPRVQQEIFNGVYFEAGTQTGAGGIIRVLGSDSTRVSIYYRKFTLNPSDSIKYDTLEQVLNFELYSLGRANVYERNLKPELPIYDTLVEPEADQIDSTFYLHGINGIEGRIVISDFNSVFPDSTPVAINRALITIQAEDSSFLNAETYQILPAFYVYNDDRNDPYLQEFISYDSYGGLIYSPVWYSRGEYKFAATSRIVKSLNEGKDKIVLRLVPAENHKNPSRVALKGQNNQTFTVRVNITYTIFNSN